MKPAPAPRPETVSRPALHPLSLLAAAACLLLAACAPSRPLTPHSASERAALLANEECRKRYGLRPFTGDDYEAVMDGGRWTWGGEGSLPVDGFSVEVSFAADGREARVSVHRDELFGNPDGL